MLLKSILRYLCSDWKKDTCITFVNCQDIFQLCSGIENILWQKMYLKVKFFFNQTIILDMRLCLSSLSSIVHCCSIAVCNDLNVMWHKNKCEVQPYSADLERVCKKKCVADLRKILYAVYLLISSEFSKNVCQTWVTDRDWRYCKSKSNDWLQVPL